jgi:FKBP-type peptidyl-prolyl cis-trans isomerase FkpA
MNSKKTREARRAAREARQRRTQIIVAAGIVLVAAIAAVVVISGTINKSSGPRVTESGLQIEDIKVGDGVAAQAGSTVVVHYTGYLEDGTKFQSSKDFNQTFDFVLGQGQVIPGWDEGLVGMRVGGTRKLTIPPSLAYGSQGSPPLIPPDATLIFEVELVDVR